MKFGDVLFGSVVQNKCGKWQHKVNSGSNAIQDQKGV